MLRAEGCLVESTRRPQGVAQEPSRPSLPPTARILFGRLHRKAYSFPFGGNSGSRQQNTATVALVPF